MQINVDCIKASLEIPIPIKIVWDNYTEGSKTKPLETATLIP
jgi:hypothetical protein